MTIKDMAAAFYVIDPNKKGDGDDKIATIDCHNSKGADVGGKAGTVGADDPTKCNHPAFSIKRYESEGSPCREYDTDILSEIWSSWMGSTLPPIRYTLASYPLLTVIAS